MKQLIDLVNKSFVDSKKFKDQKEKVAELKMNFVSNLTDEQCIKFLEFWVKVEEMIKMQTEEYINHTHKVCKDVFKLRWVYED